MSHAEVNGLSLYFEEHGSGEPLILLHGGLGAGEMFAPLVPALSENRRVIVVDLQGHGRTADIDRPLRPELMADDIAALIKHLGFEQADLLGYSRVRMSHCGSQFSTRRRCADSWWSPRPAGGTAGTRKSSRRWTR